MNVLEQTFRIQTIPYSLLFMSMHFEYEAFRYSFFSSRVPHIPYIVAYLSLLRDYNDLHQLMSKLSLFLAYFVTVSNSLVPRWTFTCCRCGCVSALLSEAWRGIPQWFCVIGRPGSRRLQLYIIIFVIEQPLSWLRPVVFMFSQICTLRQSYSQRNARAGRFLIMLVTEGILVYVCSVTLLLSSDNALLTTTLVPSKYLRHLGNAASSVLRPVLSTLHVCTYFLLVYSMRTIASKTLSRADLSTFTVYTAAYWFPLTR